MKTVCRVAALSLVLALVLPAAVARAQDAAVLKELSRLEDSWAAAVMMKDSASVARLLSPKFISMSDDGRVMDKATLVKEIGASTRSYVSAGNTGYKVQVFGDTAIIVGSFSGVMKTATGTETRRAVWTDTWMKQADGQWLCIASQSATLAK